VSTEHRLGLEDTILSASASPAQWRSMMSSSGAQSAAPSKTDTSDTLVMPGASGAPSSASPENVKRKMRALPVVSAASPWSSNALSASHHPHDATHTTATPASEGGSVVAVVLVERQRLYHGKWSRRLLGSDPPGLETRDGGGVREWHRELFPTCTCCRPTPHLHNHHPSLHTLSPTHPPAHSPAHPPTHPSTHSSTHSSTHPPTHSHTPTHRPPPSLSDMDEVESPAGMEWSGPWCLRVGGDAEGWTYSPSFHSSKSSDIQGDHDRVRRRLHVRKATHIDAIQVPHHPRERAGRVLPRPTSQLIPTATSSSDTPSASPTRHTPANTSTRSHAGVDSIATVSTHSPHRLRTPDAESTATVSTHTPRKLPSPNDVVSAASVSTHSPHRLRTFTGAESAATVSIRTPRKLPSPNDVASAASVSMRSSQKLPAPHAAESTGSLSIRTSRKLPVPNAALAAEPAKAAGGTTTTASASTSLIRHASSGGGGGGGDAGSGGGGGAAAAAAVGGGGVAAVRLAHQVTCATSGAHGSAPSSPKGSPHSARRVTSNSAATSVTPGSHHSSVAAQTAQIMRAASDHTTRVIVGSPQRPSQHNASSTSASPRSAVAARVAEHEQLVAAAKRVAEERANMHAGTRLTHTAAAKGSPTLWAAMRCGGGDDVAQSSSREQTRRVDAALDVDGGDGDGHAVDGGDDVAAQRVDSNVDVHADTEDPLPSDSAGASGTIGDGDDVGARNDRGGRGFDGEDEELPPLPISPEMAAVDDIEMAVEDAQRHQDQLNAAAVRPPPPPRPPRIHSYSLRVLTMCVCVCVCVCGCGCAWVWVKPPPRTRCSSWKTRDIATPSQTTFLIVGSVMLSAHSPAFLSLTLFDTLCPTERPRRDV
jgi:hypothetical protein